MLSSAFDWGTFFTSVSSAVLVALLIDYSKDASKKLLDRFKNYLVRMGRRIRCVR